MSSYGTLNPQTTGRDDVHQHPNARDADADADQERAHLLGENSKPKHSLATRLSKHLNAPISTTRGDIVLLFCYLITGLLDSAAVSTWGSFVSMQTGNTVYLGTGLLLTSTHPNTRSIRSLLSISAFCAGSLLFSRFHRALGGTRRWVIVASYTGQLLLLGTAAAIVTAGPSSSSSADPFTPFTLLPLALVSLQAAGQAHISRVLGFGGLTSVVLTSNYCDLFADPRLLAGWGANPERNRRVAAPVLLLLGAVGGAEWVKWGRNGGVEGFGGLDGENRGLVGALWCAVGLKAVVVVAWCFWAAEKKSDEDDGERRGG